MSQKFWRAAAVTTLGATMICTACGSSGNKLSDAAATKDGNIVGTPGGSGRYFDHGFFYDDVSNVAPAPDSKSQIAALRAAGGWGQGDVMRIDFTIDVVDAVAATTRAPYQARETWVDCDNAPVPLPVGGTIEGEPGYTCSDINADCHLLVWAARKRNSFWYQAIMMAIK